MMRVHGWTAEPVIKPVDGPRPIVMQLGQLRLSFTPDEARDVADALHDYVDTYERENRNVPE